MEKGRPPGRLRHSWEARCRLVGLMLSGLSPQAASRACGMSRATAYRLLRRFEQGGWSALRDRPPIARRRGAFPATGMALTAGPIARSKTGEHDPPFAVNVRLRHVRFPTLQQWPHHRYTNYRSRSIRVGGYGPLLH
jgi:hypothetical protein